MTNYSGQWACKANLRVPWKTRLTYITRLDTRVTQCMRQLVLAYFDAEGEAEAPQGPKEPPRRAGSALERMRPLLSDHVTPRLRITSVPASVAAGGSEGGPAETSRSSPTSSSSSSCSVASTSAAPPAAERGQ